MSSKVQSNKVHMGHTARKRFGQNFLHDRYVIDQIVAAINPQPGQNLVEIGPGLAALTEPVASQMDKMTVVELDRDLAARLREHPTLKDKLTVIEADAMRFDFGTLMGEGKPPLRIFGNLPYNISTPLIFHLCEFADRVEDMHFMLQKEVVERLAAGPGGGDWGRLSIMVQYHCRVEHLFNVGPGAFNPPPKVDSAIVRLVPHDVLPHPAKDHRLLERVVREAFNMRRKTLRNTLKQLLPAEAIEAAAGDDDGQKSVSKPAQYYTYTHAETSEESCDE